jgi:hypothetical protein
MIRLEDYAGFFLSVRQVILNSNIHKDQSNLNLEDFAPCSVRLSESPCFSSVEYDSYSLMQSFDPFPLIPLRISKYLPGFYEAGGYILSEKVSLHDFRNLCTRFVTSVQYEEPLLYTLDTFVPLPGTIHFLF